MAGAPRDPEDPALQAGHAEEHLAEERRIFFSGPVVVFKWRNAPGWPVDYVSPNVEQVFGYRADEFLSGAVSYAELIDAGDLERVAREVSRAGESGRDRFDHEPYRFRRKDGRSGWLDDHTTILRAEDGSIDYYLGYVIDATERKLFEEESARLRTQLLHAQKLESLGVLAGGIAHDFNNLLTGILGCVDLVQAAPSLAAAAKHLELIRTSATRAADLCQQMLAYSGRGQFVIDAYDLDELIRDTSDLLEVAVSKRAVLRYDLAGGLPSIDADATQIGQLMMNLVTNASDAIGAREGVIAIATGQAGDAGGEFVYARVTDDGCGMDAETRQRLFEPFFTTKAEGRGLGLAAALGILRGHRGTIHVESEPGRGTSIEVRFPPSPRVPRARIAAPPYDAAWRGSGVALVVDDEEIVRILARSVLEAGGFQVRTAEDGEEGLALYDEIRGEVAVVALDLTMPGMSGIETMQELVARRAALPVVLMSGYNKEELADQLGSGLGVPFVKKPFLPRELLAATRQAIEAKAVAPR
jgi:PAS domain S-box-containing protein